MSVEVFFKKFGDPLKGADLGLDISINETVAEIATQAKLLAPVYPQLTKKPNPKITGGRLRNSITYSGPGLDGGLNDSGGQSADRAISPKGGKKLGYVGASADYAVYVEYGTRKMVPQPYLRPAVQAVMGKPKLTLIGIINNAIKKLTAGKVTIVKF